jgi:hypothetical protein
LQLGEFIEVFFDERKAGRPVGLQCTHGLIPAFGGPSP